jgi:hypothetical protein
MAGHKAWMGEESNLYRNLMEKPEGNRPVGRSRRRCDGSIRMDFHEVGCWGCGWIGLAQDRDNWRALVNAVMNLMFQQNGGNF